jgi:streptogramin lyase
LDRLTSAATSGAGTWGAYSESYAYNAIGNLTNKGGVSYTYPLPGQARPHAVTGTSAGDSYTYDANGNMTARIEDGETYVQA